MSDPAVIWGSLFIVYVLAAVPMLGAASNGRRPRDALPGSLKLQQWEQREAKGNKWLTLWCVGFAALLGAWYLFR